MNAHALPRFACLVFAIISIGLFFATTSTMAQPVAAVKDDTLSSISATSAVLIVESPKAAGPESEATFQRHLNTHIVSLRSEQMLRRLISNSNSETRKTSWFTSANNPRERTNWLRDHLHASQISGTELIEVSLPDVSDPAERRTILREICDTYLAFMKEQQNDPLSDRIQMLNAVKTKIESRLGQLNAEMRTREVQLNLDGGVGRMGEKELELSKLVAQQVEAQLQAEKAKGQVDTTATALRQGQIPPQLNELIQKEPRIQQYRRRLDEVEIRLDIAKAKGDDQARAELQAEVDVLRKRLETITTEVAATAKVSFLESVQLCASEAQKNFEAISARVENLKAELGALSNSLLVYSTLQEEQKALREQLKTVREQIEEASARQPGNSVSGIRWQFMPEAEGK